jgi:TPP-dependent pyruvate/acetoin dehydrogenase alpha subunit
MRLLVVKSGDLDTLMLCNGPKARDINSCNWLEALDWLISSYRDERAIIDRHRWLASYKDMLVYVYQQVRMPTLHVPSPRQMTGGSIGINVGF